MPCGCSPDQRGGLPRAAAELKKLRAESPGLAYVEAGDLLFESTLPRKGPSGAQAELKARTLARGEELLGAAARAIGARDLALGARFVVETSGDIPLLDAGGPPVVGVRATLLVKAGGVPVGIFAAGLGPDPAQTVRARAAELHRQGARVVVLLAHPRGSWQEAQRLAQAAPGQIDLVVLGHLDDPATDPNRSDPGPPVLLSVEGQGQSLLRVDLQVPEGMPSGVFLARGEAGKQAELKELDDRIARLGQQARSAPEEMRPLYAQKLRELEQRRAQLASAQEVAPAGSLVVTATFIPLGPGIGEEPDARALVAAYDERVAEMNLRLAKEQPETCPPPARGEPAFTGVSSAGKVKGCAECHESASQFWVKTGHSHAHETLVSVRKQFSLDCISCHVTGWQQPGGVCRIDRTYVGGAGFAGRGKGREDVQCEMCHGPGSEHAKDPPGHIAAEVPAAVCMRCHEAANSPHFNDSRYRPFIVGPGHGMPLGPGEKPHPAASGSGPNEALKASLKGMQ
ncbi:MAG TPA: multiheme c-type cytochrome [Myxococcales bacterium]|nr:multiheme c-type cytochrome [Myxococcales bacterium]